MAQYLVTTPNPEYTGEAYGVGFSRGKATLSPANLNRDLGLTVDEIARRMEKELGYTVRLLEDADREAEAHTAPANTLRPAGTGGAAAGWTTQGGIRTRAKGG